MRSKFKWIFTLLLAFTMQFSFAQEKTVTGTVSDKTGPLPGANVVVKGTTRSAQADFDGKYSIKATTGEVLVFSFTGYTNSNVTIGAASTYNVILAEGSVKLEEVVVEGYRNTTKATTVVAQSTVNAKTIENRPNASFVQTLQGQVAGLNIASGSGQPGAKPTVIIRGVGTLNASSDPLYVIDGIPTNGDNFRSINPTDIESATVLKDAAATAIYGNRGSNGVIVIKTKRGGTQEGKTKFRFSTTTGYTQIQKAQYSFADARQLLTIERTAGVGRGAANPDTGLPFTDAEIAAYSVNTDWVDYFFRTAKSTEHQFSVETSGKRLNSYTSVSYLDQEGILQGTGMKRFTLRSNMSGKSDNDKFSYSTNLSLGFSKNNEATSLGTGGINQNYVLGATLGAPYIGPDEYQDSVQLLQLYQDSGSSLLYTPLFLIDKLAKFKNNTDELRIMASGEMSYELLKSLTARSRTSVENITTRFTQSQHPISFNGFVLAEDDQEFGGFEDINNRREFRFNQLWQLDFTKTFAEKHTVSLVGNAEYYTAQVNTNNVRQNGLDPLTFVPGTGAGWIPDNDGDDIYGVTGNMSKIKHNLISYFGVLDYDYNDRYGIVGTYRYDGSNRFLEDYAWGSFWSVGARWNINKEAFLKDTNLFQVLKLRASIGETGNERVLAGTEFSGLQPPPTRDSYAVAQNAYANQPGYAISFGANDLQWEVTRQMDFGLDFEMFKNRLRGTFDYYKKTTVDIFDAKEISPVTGDYSIDKNTDIDIVNTGFEISLAYDVVRNENFKFTVRGNVNKNDNVVNGILQNEGTIVSGNVITRNGGPALEYYLVPYVGVNPANGNMLFQAADGTLTESPSADFDRVQTGKSQLPTYQGGFGFDLDYKGFFATSNFTFVQDIWRLDFDLDGLYDSTTSQLGQFVVTDDLLNAWTPTNTNTNVPALNGNLGADDASDRFLRDASYVRLRYLQLGYKVPKKFLEKTFLTSLSFYVQGENLKTWTKWQGFDAESNRAGDQGQYPTPKIFSFGVDIKF
jgi:TonB-linked SusC/RagA family outer membrane protein